jgi:cysteinyl-tRNA synthetase
VLRLYDTRLRDVVPVEPARRGQLRLYTCGTSTARPVHVGHLRTILLGDLIRRVVERRRLAVMACLGISDTGNAAAGEPGPPGPELARQHENAFHADCAALGIRPPESTPRASASIGAITGLIEQLLAGGHAYSAGDGSVCFLARSFAGYGDLASPPVPDQGSHDGAADWALWTAVPGGDLTWPAPRSEEDGASRGVPAWPAQCSAMARHDLGDVIDLHIGSAGQRFPHHEQERAQSDSAAGHQVVRHWLHGERLLFEGGELAGPDVPDGPDGAAGPAGNVVLLADLAERGLDPLALRLAFLERHYRQPLDLTWPALAEADAALRRWRAQVANWATHPSRPLSAPHAAQVTGAFEDDLDTPAALAALQTLAGDPEVPPGAKFETFAHVDQLLGLDLASEIGRAW